MNTLTLLVLLFVFNSMYNCERDVCSSKLCKCIGKTVKCSNMNLTYIPLLPRNIRSLYFDHNYLPLIHEHTFSNATHRRLEILTLENCNIINITTNSFKILKHLKRLQLSSNPLTTDSLFNFFLDLKDGLYYSFIFQNIGLKNIPQGLFRNNSTLSVLDISDNLIKTLNFTEFSSLGLNVLKVKNNSIETIVMDKMDNLVKLMLLSNNITSLPDFCQEKYYFSSLKELNIQANYIRDYVPLHVNCLQKLSKFILHENYISSIQSGSFQELSSLIHLGLSEQQRNSKKSFSLEKYSFNNSNIAKLTLFNNDIKIKHIDPLAFSGCSGVKYLLFSDNSLNDAGKGTSRHLGQVLSELNSLQYLDLRKTKINEIPTSIQNFTKLQFLNLFDNGISNWQDDFWDGNSKLTYIDLGRNLLKKVSKEMFPAKFRSQLKTISLQYNPIDCICENVWFIEWVNRDHEKFKNYPFNYTCLNMTERICLKPSSTSIYVSITGVCCIILVLLILVSIVYKYRWFIKYQIYIWRHKPKHLNNMAERQCLYDVFVSYSAEDVWVLDHLVPQLEEHDGIKLCIHERDFQTGRLIIDNIVESIENSRRVLVILSNNFARSEWCQFEMTLAQKHVLNQAIEPLSVVLLEDIDSENMSNSLQALLNTTTYITWYDNAENIHLFWDRLKNSLT